MEKLTRIKEVIDTVCKMPHKIEAPALLCSCLTQCKIMHIMRMVPQNTVFDSSLKKGLEKILADKT